MFLKDYIGYCVGSKLYRGIRLRKGGSRDISWELFSTDSHKVRWWIGHDDNSKSSGNGQILDIFERKPTEYVDRLNMCYIRKKNHELY